MIRALLLSLRLHLSWWLRALSPAGRRLAPLGPRRLAVLLLLYPLFLVLQAVHWCGFALDELLFRGYRRVRIREPLFVSGIPRSGTTFVHRNLARDTAQFTTFRTWEALFAPSVSERRLIAACAWLDRRLGAPLQRLLAMATRRLAGGLDHIHAVGLEAPEEDYLALLPAGGCFILMLAFPADRSLWQLGRLDELPHKQRRILLDFHTACLQKHLYVHGPERRLLSKNAAFGSWLPALAERFPDARFLVCLRDPAAALRSQMSAIHPGLKLFATLPASGHIQRRLQQNLDHTFRQLRTLNTRLAADRIAVIDQAGLRAQPTQVLAGALERLGVPLSPGLKQMLAELGQAANEHTSAHQYRAPASAADEAEFAARLVPLYRQLVAQHAVGGLHEPS